MDRSMIIFCKDHSYYYGGNDILIFKLPVKDNVGLELIMEELV